MEGSGENLILKDTSILVPPTSFQDILFYMLPKMIHDLKCKSLSFCVFCRNLGVIGGSLKMEFILLYLR